MPRLFTSLPRQLYVHVERRFIGEGDGLERASWFGLTSIPGRSWGLSLLLECGAIYSHVPPHAIALEPWEGRNRCTWSATQAQPFDCHGLDFAVHEYEQLHGREVLVRTRPWPLYLPSSPWTNSRGLYLFTAQHYGDGYSLEPEQAKQYHFVHLEHGRLAAVPANHMLVHDGAFTEIKGWPTWLRRQTEVYAGEEAMWSATAPKMAAEQDARPPAACTCPPSFRRETTGHKPGCPATVAGPDRD